MQCEEVAYVAAPKEVASVTSNWKYIDDYSVYWFNYFDVVPNCTNYSCFLFLSSLIVFIDWRIILLPSSSSRFISLFFSGKSDMKDFLWNKHINQFESLYKLPSLTCMWSLCKNTRGYFQKLMENENSSSRSFWVLLNLGFGWRVLFSKNNIVFCLCFK